MHLKLLCCNVFQREACHCLVRTPHVVDVDFIQLGEHERPDVLRASLQAQIDRASLAEPPYDAILLLFGLCGNATVGLRAGRVPLVMPRAHDCATVLLGSRAAFRQHFADNPSQPFGSIGYFERGNDYMLKRPGDGSVEKDATYLEYVKQYGEENARYIWDEMHPPHMDRRAVFIAIPETAGLGLGSIEKFRAQAEAAGQEYVQLTGDLRLVEALIAGRWQTDDFLVVPPGRRIVGVYDWDTVAQADE
jgi:hypothetical protein